VKEEIRHRRSGRKLRGVAGAIQIFSDVMVWCKKEWTMAPLWYVRRGDIIRGPFSTRELRELAAQGDLNELDYFREGDTGRWTSGKKVRGLFDRSIAHNPSRVILNPDSSQHGDVPQQLDVKGLPRRRQQWKIGYFVGISTAGVLLLIAWQFREQFLRNRNAESDFATGPTIRQPSNRQDDLEDLRRQIRALEEEVRQSAATPISVDKTADEVAADLEANSRVSVAEKSPTAAELPALIRKIEPSIVSIECKLPQGTTRGAGFVVKSRDIVATNLHVLSGALDATVILANGDRLPVRGVWATEAETDIALLAVDLPADQSLGLSLAAGECSKGERVLALGSPKGLASSATEGIVSAVRTGQEIIAALGLRATYHERGLDDRTVWIQSSAPISAGNSGGPLLNEAGEVVGINTWSHQPGNDINFAVASAHVRKLLAHLPTDPMPLAQFPAAPAILPAAQVPPVEIEGPAVALKRMAQLRSIYEQRLVLLARREVLDAKILDIRSRIESVEADQTNLAHQGSAVVGRAALTEEDLARLSNQKRFARDPIEAQTYDLAIEQRRAELRSLASAASALQAQAAANRQLIGDLNRQMVEARQAHDRLWNEQRSLRSEFIELADPFGKLARGDHEAGIVALSEWIALDTGNPEAYLARALAHAHLGQSAEALEDFNRALESAASPSAEILAARGWLQVRGGDAKAGERDLRQALAIDRMSAIVYLFRGMAALENDRESTAIKEFRDAVRVEPNHVEGHRQLAWVLATAQNAKLRKGKQALAAAQRASALTNSNNVACLQTLAAAHAAVGEFAEALRCIDAAIALQGAAADLELQKKAYEQLQPWVRVTH
jgi:S1-C subfamily serine protease/tetratricopeptide (TPR) repeat protein